MVPDRLRWRAPWRRAAARPRPPHRDTSVETARAAQAAPPTRATALGRCFLGHVLPKLLERRSLQARDVHLADAEAAGDLRLRHLLVEPHGHDRPLAWSQMLHRAVEQVAHLNAVQLRVGTADLLRDRAA